VNHRAGRALLRQSGTYLAIGAGCAILANVVIIVGSLCGLHYALGSLVAFVVVGAIGYAGHSRWTFPAPPSWPGYGRFMLGLAGGALWSLALLGIGVSVLGWPVALVSPAVTALVTIWNFLAARWAIVRRPRPPSIRQAG
jgi:putative flippase GtrA